MTLGGGVFLPLLNKMLPRMLDPRDRGGVALRCESATSGAILSITSGYNSLGLPTRMVDAHVCAKGRLGEFFWILASRCSARFFRSLEDLKNLRRLLLITYRKCSKNTCTPPHTWDTSTLFVGADHSIWGRRSPGLGDAITPSMGRGQNRRLSACKVHILKDKKAGRFWGCIFITPNVGLLGRPSHHQGVLVTLFVGARGRSKLVGHRVFITPFVGSELALQAVSWV